jgi:hypothetical protein
MVKRPQRALTYLQRRGVVTALVVGISLFFSAPAWSKSKVFCRKPQTVWHQESHEETIGPSPQAFQGFRAENFRVLIARRQNRSHETGEDRVRKQRANERSSPEEKSVRKEKRQEWESLPPEEKERLRQRMRRFKEFSPDDRAIFRQRFHQWQKLSPKERQRVRENLEKWNDLPPEEKERIRLRFR